MKSTFRFSGILGMMVLLTGITAAEQRPAAVSPGKDVGIAADQDPKDEELKAKYAKILGEYELTMEDQSAILKIHVENGALLATPPDGDTITLEPVEGAEFTFQGEDEFAGKIDVRFEKDDQGDYTICVVVVKDLEMEMRGTKIK
jgi:hypothetical protein